MTRELPDELLSAYLDGEVTPEERAAVEAHLATSEADRQLLAELRSLRSDMATLPRANVTRDFTDRVVQAAVAAKATNPAVAIAGGKRNWLLVAAGLATTAACLFVAVQLWRPTPNPIAATPAAHLIAALHSAVPGDGQAAVLRLRLPRNVSLESALAAAGIASQLPTANTGATELGAAYRNHLANKVGAQALEQATLAAEEALYVEAPLTHLEKLLLTLASDPARPCELRREAQLAFAGPRPRIDDDLIGVGESAAAKAKLPAPGQPYVQQLPPGLFRLEKQTTQISIEPAGTTASGQKLVRVLILVERIEVR